jgi:hypothetical protein
LVRRFHYSHRPPANVQQVVTAHVAGGLFGNHGPCVGACYFSIPPTRWSEEVYELSRLVRHEDYRFPISALVGFATRRIRGAIDLVVSFADWSQGHMGTIYQACSWNYGGLRKCRMDGVTVEGRFVPGRSANSIYGTQSPTKLSSQLGVDVEGHWDEGKRLYWKAFSPSGSAKAKRLGLEKRAPPKKT